MKISEEDIRKCFFEMGNFIVNFLKSNKSYIIWVIYYLIILYPLKLMVEWYRIQNPKDLDLRVWFGVLSVYLVLTILFIWPILKDDEL
jgi:hypothetical protein